MELPASPDSEPWWRTVWSLYKIPVLLGSGSVVCIGLSALLLVRSAYPATPIRFSESNQPQNSSNQSTQSAKLASMVFVDVEGAVAHPGIYAIPAGGRVEDALRAAGGLNDKADIDLAAQTINRAMKAADGMKIFIPSKSHNIGNSMGTDDTSYNNTNSAGSMSQNNGGTVSVNFASADQLDLLPGVGPVTATKIIDNRPYASLEDLVAKKAIGPALFEKIKNQLSL